MRKAIFIALAALAATACQRELPADAHLAASATADAAPVDNPMRPKALAPTLLTGGSGLSTPGTLCSLDGFGESSFTSGQVAVDGAAPVLLHGWVGIDGAEPASPSSALVKFSYLGEPQSSWGVDVPVNGRREDVATVRNAPGLTDSGLNAVLDLSALPAGRYRVSLEYGAESRYSCDGGWVIEVRK